MVASLYVLLFSLASVQSVPRINWSTLISNEDHEINPLVPPRFSRKSAIYRRPRPNGDSTTSVIDRPENRRSITNNIPDSLQATRISLRPILLLTSRKLPEIQSHSFPTESHPKPAKPRFSIDNNDRGGSIRKLEIIHHEPFKIKAQPILLTNRLPTPGILAMQKQSTTIEHIQQPPFQYSNDRVRSLMLSLEKGANAFINLFRNRFARDNGQNPPIVYENQNTKPNAENNRPRWVITRSHPKRYRNPSRYNHPNRDTTKETLASEDKKKSIEDEEWAKLLFGPNGILTELFHIIDQKQKDFNNNDKVDKPKPLQHAATQRMAGKPETQADLLFPDFSTNSKPLDFAKFFHTLMSNSHEGFEDPIIELPEFLGICNRLSCGDIYKAIDQFRKSEFFSNFQTALQLMQDPKGWQIIGDLLSNPELIAQFTGGNGFLEKLLGSAISPEKPDGNSRGSRKPSKEIVPEDGDFGIDFSSMVEPKSAKEHKPTVEELPEIAENVDGEDYYNAIESGTDEDGVETIMKPDEIIVATKGAKTKEELPETIKGNQRPTSMIPKRASPLPPIATTTTKEMLKKTISLLGTATSSGTIVQITSTRPKVNIEDLKTTKSFREGSDYYSMYYND